MSVTLTIGGLPVCGVVGNGAKLTIPKGDCWAAYHKWVTGLAEKDEEGKSVPLCVLKRYAIWAVNGQRVVEPTSWFIVLVDSQSVDRCE